MIAIIESFIIVVGAAGFDTSKYMEAMGGVLQNPEFMTMAEKLGQQIMQVRPDAAAVCMLRHRLICLMHMVLTCLLHQIVAELRMW